MKLKNNAGMRLLALVLSLMLLFAYIPDNLPNASAHGNQISHSVGGNNPISIAPLSDDIDNPTNISVRLVTGESSYNVTMRPGIINMTKYLYTDPSYDEQYLIAVGDCRTETVIDLVWTVADPGLYPIQVQPGETIELWIKYVENYPFNPTTLYYHVILTGPPSTSGTIYMESLAGQSTHPPHGGFGTSTNPFTATIYVPLFKDSIDNPDSTGVDGDIVMTGNGFDFLFADDTFTQPESTMPLSIGVNHIYTSVLSPSSYDLQFYDITVFRGNPFSKTSKSMYYNPGGDIDYVLSWVLPESIGGIGEIAVIDKYDVRNVGFSSIVSFNATIPSGPVELIPEVDFTAENDEDTGDLTISVTADGLAKLEDEAKMSIELRFIALETASGTISNSAQLIYDDALFGEGHANVIESDFTIDASIENYTTGNSGQTVTYTSSFTLPENLEDTENFRVVETIPEGLLFTENSTLKIGDEPAVLTEVETNEDGELSVVIPTEELTGGVPVQLAFSYDISREASGVIETTASLYHTPAGGSEVFVKTAGVSINPITPGTPMPESVSVRLRARKIISGEGAVLSAGQFSFAVYSNGMQVATATNDAAGNIAFPLLEFTREGTYYFFMKETMSDGTYYGWSADDSEIEVSVTVRRGTYGLTAQINYPDDEGFPEFHNQYWAGTATLNVSKVLYDEFGLLSDSEGVFWVVLFVREDDGWTRVGRYPIPANEGSTIIPDLPSGRTYQLVEEDSIDGSYTILGMTVSVGHNMLGNSAERYVTFVVPPLSTNTEIEVIITNQGEPGESDIEGPIEEEDEEDGEEEILIPEEDSPLGGLFITEHYAYILGYPDNTVRPGQNITRAEVATVFFRLLADSVRLDYWTTTNTFSDVPAGNWYNNAVSVMSNMGIVNGYPSGLFRPDGSITRAELSTIAARFARETWEMPMSELSFTDIDGHWAEHDILYSASVGWVNGYPDGTFRPNQPITRAEFMTMVNRMVERIPETIEDMLTSEMVRWTDNSVTSAWFYIAVQEATNSHHYELKQAVLPGTNLRYEYWLEMLPNRNWSSLERQWAS